MGVAKKRLIDWIAENPEFSYLLDEWDTERNREELGLEIEDVSYRNNKKVYWICKECNSSFLQAIGKRTYRGDMCNECNKLYNWVKKHQEYKYLLEEFDYERNKEELGIDIKDVTYGGTKKIYWKCRFCGKSFQRTTCNRTSKNSSNYGCEECSRKFGRKKAVQGYCNQGRSLKEWCEKNNRLDLLEEFDYEENMKEFGITPKNITYGGNARKLNWICKKCGTRYKACVNNKTNGNKECCPKCNKSKHTSFSEQAIYFYIKQAFPDAINSYKPDWLKPSEIDIYVPKLNLGIEYDGQNWHQNAERDYSKNNLLKEHNVNLIRIREGGCPILLRKDCKYVYNTDKYSDDYITNYLYRLIEYINKFYNLNLNIDVNICRDNMKIRSEFVSDLKSQSLMITHPEIAKEWHPTKNGGLKPEYFSYGSDAKVWWQCSKYGGEYQAIISNRLKYGCYCCNKIKRDLAKQNEWFKKCSIIKKYYTANKNLLILKNNSYLETEDGRFNIYHWIINQRYKYRVGELSSEQIDKLKELEPIWNRNRKGSILGDEIKSNRNKWLDETKELKRLWDKSNEIFMNSKAEETETQKWTKIKYVNKKGVEKKDVWKEEKAG